MNKFSGMEINKENKVYCCDKKKPMKTSNISSKLNSLKPTTLHKSDGQHLCGFGGL
jgi:hypothetical protein